jgi:integrase
MSAPVRRRVEPGIFERLNIAGERLGLEIQYKDANGIPRRRSVQGGITEARDALAQARSRRVRREAEAVNPRMTLAAVIEEFKAAHVGQRASTREVYSRAFTRIEPVLGAKRITAIGRADVRRFVGSLLAEGLRANTVLSHYSSLRRLFSFAKDDLDVPVTFPKLKPSELPDPSDDARGHRVLDDDELARVLDACEDGSRLYFRVLAETGCRAAEALGLTPTSIGEGTIAISRQMARDGSLVPLKTRQSKRVIEVTRSLAAELRLAGDRELIFPGLKYPELLREWDATVARAGINPPRPTPHDLRHTHCSRLVAARWDVIEISRRLGDRVETILSTYAHEFDAHRRGAARRDALEELYGQDRGAQRTGGEVVNLRRSS